MKTMRLILATLAVVAISTASASAKPRHHHKPKPAKVQKVVKLDPIPDPFKIGIAAIRTGVNITTSILDAVYVLDRVPAAWVPQSQEEIARVAEARRYVVATTLAEGPGGTMMMMANRIVAKMPKEERAKLSRADVIRIGVETNISMLHPVFVVRLAGAIKEARNRRSDCTTVKRKYLRKGVYRVVTSTHRCLTNVALFSGVRPYGYGVSGWGRGREAQSAHTYGIAGDMRNIGRPGSEETRRWQEIARRHGIYSPYGPNNGAEWNHVMATNIKTVLAFVPALRKTVDPTGPIDLSVMWNTAAKVIDRGADVKVADISARRRHARVARGHHRVRYAARHRVSETAPASYASHFAGG